MTEGGTTPGQNIGADTGGTFTDLVRIDGDGRLISVSEVRLE